MGRGQGEVPWGAVVGAFLALPVALGVTTTLFRLLGTDHPDVGWASTINADAASLATGQGIFNDPDAGYAGMFFTPLFPIAIAGLFHLAWWEGWGTLLAIASGVALAGMATAVALLPAAAEPRRAVRVLEAVGIGALAWSFVATLEHPELFEGQADVPAWTLALGGLLLVPRALGGSTRALATAVLLLSAGLWTKQTTASLVASAVLVSAVWAWLHPAARRPAVVLTLLVIAVNGLAILALAVLTDGWGLRWTVELSSQFPVFNSLGSVAAEFIRDIALVAAFAMVLAFQARAIPSRKPPERELLPWLLAAAAFATAITGMWGRRLEGSTDHNFIGAVSCVALLVAFYYRAVRVRAPHTAWLAVAAVGLTALIPGQHSLSLRRGDLVPVASFGSFSTGFLDYARSHVVYTPSRADFAGARGGPVYPNTQHLLNALEGGYRPGFFLRALLGRRFDVVYPFEERQTPFADPRGAFEDNFLWKLNRVIETKYMEAPATPVLAQAFVGGAVGPVHGFVPRRGPDPAAWMDRCFGPFTLGGETFDIGSGGGFWCQAGHGLVERETPAAVSEVVSRNPVESAEIVVTLPRRSGGWALRGGPLGAGQVRAHPVDGGLALSLGRQRVTVPARRLRQSGGAVRLRFTDGGEPAIELGARGPDATVHTGSSAPARLAFAAKGGSGASVRIE